MKTNRIDILKRENIIWIIYVIFAILGIKANNLEIEDIKNNSNKNKKKYKGINIFIFIISIIIYIYFSYLTYTYYKENKTRANLFLVIGSNLILIGGILLFLAELEGDEVVPNEV